VKRALRKRTDIFYSRGGEVPQGLLWSLAA
jgi:hypothetical protein